MSKTQKNAAKVQKTTKAPKAEKATTAEKAPKAEAQKDRKYALKDEVVKGLLKLAKTEKKFPNPYRSGAYHATVEALAMTLGKWQTFDQFKQHFVKAMGADWADFSHRAKRNENGLDVDGRILQNVNVLRRPDYGMKLQQVGYRIETDKSEKGLKVRLAPVAK